jgi:hypothetical protein
MHVPRGDLQTARVHREWLRKLPEMTGKPLTRIAKEIKIAPSTLTRPLKEGDDGTSTLHANTIAKIVAHTGAPVPTTQGPPASGRRSRQGFSEDAVPFTAQAGDPINAAVAAFTANHEAFALWTIRTRAVELAGFTPGDIAILDLNGAPQPGDVVCAQVYNWGRMSAETVVRVFERAAPVELLVAKTLDPGLQQPIVIDGERVIVKGVFLPHRLRAAAV